MKNKKRVSDELETEISTNARKVGTAYVEQDDEQGISEEMKDFFTREMSASSVCILDRLSKIPEFYDDHNPELLNPADIERPFCDTAVISRQQDEPSTPPSTPVDF